MKYKVLIVDDEPANLRMLERLFRADHDVITAASGAEALEMLSRFDAALIISDQRMPGMTGIEFLQRAANMRPQTVRIILTGYTDVNDLVEAINSGVIYKYITKPWVNTDLRQTVQRAIEHYESIRHQHQLAQENERFRNRLSMAVGGTVNLMTEMIRQRNPAMADHCKRTAHYAAFIGEQFKLDAAEMEQLTFAAQLHEFPHIRLPYEIGVGTTLMAEQIRSSQASYEEGLRLIECMPELQEAATIIRYQHEHFDGTGFFDGLAKEQIPFLSRILAVADAFDEINSGRNPALFCTDEEVTVWMRERSGTIFDPHVVDACLDSDLSEPIGFTSSPSLNIHTTTPAAF